MGEFDDMAAEYRAAAASINEEEEAKAEDGGAGKPSRPPGDAPKTVQARPPEDEKKKGKRPTRPVRPSKTKNKPAGVAAQLKNERLGERVRAKIDGWSQFYKGVVSKCNNDGTFQVSFDDGDVQKKVTADQIEKEKVECEFSPGDQIEAKIYDWETYYSGKIVSKAGHGSYAAEFDDGDKVAFLPWDCIRKVSPLGDNVRASRLGERVRAKIDGWDQFYKGVITQCNEDDSFEISFDDGEVVGKVTPGQIEKEEVLCEYQPGDRIEAKISDWPTYYSGKVVAKAGHGSYSTEFDDGDKVEFMPWDCMRKERPKLHKPGTRVLATISSWKGSHPGVVQAANLNGTYQILFDDGEVKDSVKHEDVSLAEKEQTEKKTPPCVKDESPKQEVQQQQVEDAVKSNEEQLENAVSQESGEIETTENVEVKEKVDADTATEKENTENVEVKEKVDADTATEKDQPASVNASKANETSHPQNPEANEKEEEPAKEQDGERQDPGNKKHVQQAPEVAQPISKENQPAEPSAPLKEKQTRPTPKKVIEPELIQVAECRFRNLLRMRARGRDGGLDTARALRVFQKKRKDPTQERLLVSEFSSALTSLGLLLEPDAIQALADVIDPDRTDNDAIAWPLLQAYTKATVESNSACNQLEVKLRNLANGMGTLKQAFLEFDQDGSGTVDAKELCSVFEKASGEKLSVKMAETIIRMFDENGDMQLDEQEFTRFVLPRFPLYVMTPAGQLFLSVDPNTTIAELRAIVKKRIGVVLGPIAHERVGCQRFKLAKHFGSVILEPPHCRSSMAILEVCAPGTQLYVVLDKDKGQFAYCSSETGVQRKNSAGTKLAAAGRAARALIQSSKQRLGGAAPPKSISVSDKASQLAYKRLQDVFELLDEDGNGVLSIQEAMYASKHKPQLKKIVKGSAQLSILVEDPAKVFARLDDSQGPRDSVQLDELARVLLPQLFAKTAEQVLDDAKRSTTKHWRKGKAAIAAAQSVRNRLDDSGLSELSEKMGKLMGEQEMLGLSQGARARVLSSKHAALDMKVEVLAEKDEQGRKLQGCSPTETQQWVNALSSDKWLGVSERQRRKKRLGKERDAWAAMGLPRDPARWTTSNVQAWVASGLELDRYRAMFTRVSGTDLLLIDTEDELKRLGITDKLPMARLHRKKILTHIKLLQEVRRAFRDKGPSAEDPERWNVGDVVDWLRSTERIDSATITLFKEKSVDGSLLQTLTDTDLQHLIGVKSQETRRVILSRITKLFPSRAFLRHTQAGASDHVHEPAPESWDAERVLAFVRQVCPGYPCSLAAAGDDSASKQVDGRALLSLTSPDAVMRAFPQLVHAGGGQDQAVGALLSAIAQLRQEQAVLENVDAFIRADISEELELSDRGAACGSGRDAARALQAKAQQGTIIRIKPVDEERQGRRQVPPRSSPLPQKRIETTKVVRVAGGACGRACMKAIHVALISNGVPHAEATIDSWFDSESRETISKEALFDAINTRLFPASAPLPWQPFERMWRDVLLVQDANAEIPKHKLFVALLDLPALPAQPINTLDKAGDDVGEAVNEADARVRNYLRALSKAIGRVRVLEFKAASRDTDYHQSTQALISKLIGQVQGMKKQLAYRDRAMCSLGIEQSLKTLEKEWDRALLGEY